MAVSFRGATSANGGSATATSITPTLTGTSWAAGDLVLINIAVGNSGSFSFPSGWIEIFDTSNTGSAAFTTGIAYRVMQSGDSNPAITFSGTAGKWSWTAIALQPGAGEVMSLDAAGTVKSDTTTATTHTANATTAVSSSVASVILSSYRASATGATAITTTPPTNWTEPAGGDTSTATGTTTATRQISTAVSYRTGQSGTVTPGSETTSVSTTANVYNVLVASTPTSSKSDSDSSSSTESQATAAIGTTYRNFPSTNGGSVANDTTAYTLGVEFYVTDPDVRLMGFWWWCPTSGSTASVASRLYTVDNSTSGTAVAGSDGTSGTLTANSWNYIELAKPVLLTANQRYRACIQGGGTANWYSAIASGFAADSTHGPLVVPSTANSTGLKQGSFVVGATMTYPNGVSGDTDYGIDVQVGVTTSSTPVSDSDSGSAAEGAVVIGLTGSETSAGTESQSIAATLSSADTATATETAIIRVSSSDSASATDNQSLAVSLSNSDSGTATEANSIAATLSSSDSSTGTDNQTITASFSNSDTSSATENQATSINITSSDSATATEGQRIALASGDTVSATDNNALVVNLSNSDQGTATELAPKIGITSTDASTMVEASAISSALSSTDNITGVDGQSIQAAISSADSVQATDFGDVPGMPTGFDTVTGQENQSIQAAFNSSDTVTGTEGQRIGVASQDTSSGTENARVGTATNDASTATEGFSIVVHVQSSDSVSATDNELVQQNGSPVDSDSASATETAKIGVASSDTASVTEGQVVYVFSSDGVTATDSQSLAATISDADSVVLQDMWIVDAILASTDALHATESEQASVALGLTGEFGEPFTDSALSMANVATHVLLNQDSWLAELRTYTEDV